MKDLEKSYSRLLRLYPTSYRRARAAEMLAALMDGAQPGQHRPAFREQWALIVGALRVHAGSHSRRATADSWRLALSAAAVILLARNTLLVSAWAYQDGFSGFDAVDIAFSCAAILAVIRARYFVAIVASLVVVVSDLPWKESDHGSLLFAAGAIFVFHWEPLIVIAMLAPLVRRKVPRPSKSVLGAATILVLSAAVQAYSIGFSSTSASNAGQLLVLLVAGAGVVWMAIDERAALTVGLSLLVNVAQVVWDVWTMPTQGWAGTVVDYAVKQQGIWLLAPMVLLAFGLVMSSRRARL